MNPILNALNLTNSALPAQVAGPVAGCLFSYANPRAFWQKWRYQPALWICGGRAAGKTFLLRQLIAPAFGLDESTAILPQAAPDRIRAALIAATPTAPAILDAFDYSGRRTTSTPILLSMAAEMLSIRRYDDGGDDKDHVPLQCAPILATEMQPPGSYHCFTRAFLSTPIRLSTSRIAEIATALREALEALRQRHGEYGQVVEQSERATAPHRAAIEAAVAIFQ